jgi:NarL family two-component system sensor histidine kinase YdfH
MNVTIDNRQTFARPFLFTITLSLIGMFVWWLFQGKILGAGGPETIEQVVIVGLLLIIQTLGHWCCTRLPRKMLLAYIAVQIALINLTNILTKNAGFSGVLSLSLIGEMFGFFESLGWAVFAYVVYWITLLFSFPLIFGASYPFIYIVWSTILIILSASPFYGALFLLVRARRQAQDLFRKLDIAHHQLAVYAEQVEQLTLSAERARMARELHDTLAQGVAGMSLQLEALEASLEQGNVDKSLQIVSQVKNRARASLHDSRRAIADLRIVPDRPDALLEAIRDEADRFSLATGVTCSLDLPPKLILQTSTMEHTLRCVTESLSNIARHARARHVTIKISVVADQLTLQIRDDGVGFDPKHVPLSGHYGLLGLRERARLIGGILDIDSSPGSGTNIRLTVALRT